MSWWLILIIVGGIIVVAGFLLLKMLITWYGIVVSTNPFFLNDAKPPKSPEDSDNC